MLTIVTAAVSVSMSIVSRIEQFYKDVKIRRREMFGEEEPAFDTRYTIHVHKTYSPFSSCSLFLSY